MKYLYLIFLLVSISACSHKPVATQDSMHNFDPQIFEPLPGEIPNKKTTDSVEKYTSSIHITTPQQRQKQEILKAQKREYIVKKLLKLGVPQKKHKLYLIRMPQCLISMERKRYNKFKVTPQERENKIWNACKPNY